MSIYCLKFIKLNLVIINSCGAPSFVKQSGVVHHYNPTSWRCGTTNIVVLQLTLGTRKIHESVHKSISRYWVRKKYEQKANKNDLLSIGVPLRNCGLMGGEQGGCNLLSNTFWFTSKCTEVKSYFWKWLVVHFTLIQCSLYISDYSYSRERKYQLISLPHLGFLLR